MVHVLVLPTHMQWPVTWPAWRKRLFISTLLSNRSGARWWRNVVDSPFGGTKRAYELMALGEKLSSEKALAMGMVNRVFPDESLRDDGIAYAKEVADRSPLALSYTKAAVSFGQTHTLDETISKEAELQAMCIDSEDAKNAVISFFNKQKPEWKGR